jgi:hypothetical protein
MKNILLVGSIIILSTAIGAASGSKSGGFIMGVVLAILISKTIYNNRKSHSPENE